MLKEALELHNNLNPAIWTKDETLLPEVEDRLLKIVHKFQSECYLPLDIVDVHLVGSNASFNYNRYSDLDVHIVVNFELVDCDKEILIVAYNLQKAKFNQDYDISIHGVNVEMYIEDINSMTASNGIYSLYNKKWINTTANKLADKIRGVLANGDFVEITKMINMLYMMRKNGLATDGEFSVGNLLFKEIRNLGLLDNLKHKLKEVQSQQLTLEGLDDEKIEFVSDEEAFEYCDDENISSHEVEYNGDKIEVKKNGSQSERSSNLEKSPTTKVKRYRVPIQDNIGVGRRYVEVITLSSEYENGTEEFKRDIREQIKKKYPNNKRYSASWRDIKELK